MIWFGVVDPAREARVVTIAGSASALPGTETGGGKVSDYADFPPKGRATGGVRAQRFLKGEDVLVLAWAGPAPIKAVSSTGKPVALPTELGRRDGSGLRLDSALAAIGGALGPDPAPYGREGAGDGLDGDLPAERAPQDGAAPADPGEQLL